MRIISSFHDYYDSVQFFGQDQSLIYLRDSKSITLDINDLKYLKLDINSGSIFYDDPVYIIPIIFCGKLYYCIKYDKKYFYSFDDFYSCLELHQKEKNIKRFIEYGYCKQIKNFINESGKRNVLELNIKYKTPIIVLKKYKSDYYSKYHNDYSKIKNEVILNDNLNNYEFYKIKDSFSTFQEISMFIGGVLSNNEDNIPIIPDNLKAQSKGFDKFSFRKRSNDISQ